MRYIRTCTVNALISVVVVTTAMLIPCVESASASVVVRVALPGVNSIIASNRTHTWVNWDNNSGIAELNSTTGTVLWKSQDLNFVSKGTVAPFQGPFTQVSMTGSTLIVVNSSNEIEELNASNGQPIWLTAVLMTANTMIYDIFVTSSGIWVTMNNGVALLSKANGDVIWKNDSIVAEPSATGFSVAAWGSRAFVVTGNKGSAICELNAANGAVVWRNGSIATNGGISSVSVSSKHVWVGDASQVVELNPLNGAVSWRNTAVARGQWVTKVVNDGKWLLVGDTNGIAELNSSTGATVWKNVSIADRSETMVSGLNAPPLFATSGANVLVAFAPGFEHGGVAEVNLTTGRTIWRDRRIYWGMSLNGPSEVLLGVGSTLVMLSAHNGR